MRIQWSPLAIERVAEIAAFIAEDNPCAAEKWVRAAFARVGQLRQFPKSGRRIPESPRPDLRELVWGNYRIVYRREARRISILTVRHVKQILPLEEL